MNARPLSRRLLTWSLLGALTHLTCCAHTQRPTERETLLPESELLAPDTETPLAKLSLLEDGLWAMTSETSLKDTERATPGALFLLTPLDTPRATPQLFAVIASYDWGAHLQRLSSHPLSLSTRYTWQPVSPEDLQLDAHLATLCRAPDTRACVPDSWAAHRTVHPLSDALTLTPAHAPHLATPTLPFLPQQRLAPEAPATPLAHPALIVLTPHSAPRATQAIAWIDPRCPEALTASLPPSLLTRREPSKHLAALDAPLPSLLTVEAEAFTHGADVLLSCPEEDAIRLLTPGLTRPWLTPRAPAHPSLGPPSLAALPLDLSRDEAQAALPALLLGHALAARGASRRAALSLLDAMNALPSARDRDTLALRLAPLLALDFPEEALRLVHHATRQSWRRDEVLTHNLTLLSVWAAFDEDARALKLESELLERASTRRDDPLAAWIIWRDLARLVAAGEIPSFDALRHAAKPRFERQHEPAQWQLAAALTWLLSPGELSLSEPHQEVAARLLEQGAPFPDTLPLLHYITRGDSPNAQAPHPGVDLYGRGFGTSPDALPLDVLLSLPALTPLHELAWQRRLIAQGSTGRTRLALSPRLPPERLYPLTQTGGVLGGWLRTPSAPDAALLATLLADASRADLTRSPWQRASHDMLAMALELRQEPASPARLAARVTSSPEESRPALLALWLTYALRAPTRDELEQTLAALAPLTPQLTDGVTCARYQIVLALRALAQGSLDQTITAQRASQRCVEGLPEARLQELSLDLEVLDALVRQEAEGRALPTPSSGLRSYIDTYLRDLPEAEQRCVGLRSSWLPWRDWFTQDLNHAAGLFAPSPHASPEADAQQAALTLRPLARERRRMAQETLDEGAAALASGEVTRAGELLALASDRARAVHATDLVRRVELIREVLLSKPDSPLYTALTEGRAQAMWRTPQEARVPLEDPEGVTLALALLYGDASQQEAALAALPETHTQRAALCEAEQLEL